MAFINVAAAAAFVATACNRACKLWQLWRLAAVSRINHNDFGGALVTAGGQNNSIQFAVGAAVAVAVRVGVGDKLNA